MKKILSLFLAAISILAFSGCMRFEEPFEASQSIEQVSYINVYYLEEPQHKLALFPEPIEALEETEFEPLIQDIEGLTYAIAILVIAPAPSPNYSYDGYVVEIKYQDGGYDLVSSAFRESFSADGQLINCDNHTHCDRELWLSMLQKYVDLDIQENK